MAADAAVDDPVDPVGQRPEQRVQDLRRKRILTILAALDENILPGPQDFSPLRIVQLQAGIFPDRHEEMQHLFQVDLHAVEKLLLA